MKIVILALLWAFAVICYFLSVLDENPGQKIKKEMCWISHLLGIAALAMTGHVLMQNKFDINHVLTLIPGFFVGVFITALRITDVKSNIQMGIRDRFFRGESPRGNANYLFAGNGVFPLPITAVAEHPIEAEKISEQEIRFDFTAECLGAESRLQIKGLIIPRPDLRNLQHLLEVSTDPKDRAKFISSLVKGLVMRRLQNIISTRTRADCLQHEGAISRLAESQLPFPEEAQHGIHISNIIVDSITDPEQVTAAVDQRVVYKEYTASIQSMLDIWGIEKPDPKDHKAMAEYQNFITKMMAHLDQQGSTVQSIQIHGLEGLQSIDPALASQLAAFMNSQKKGGK